MHQRVVDRVAQEALALAALVGLVVVSGMSAAVMCRCAARLARVGRSNTLMLPGRQCDGGECCADAGQGCHW